MSEIKGAINVVYLVDTSKKAISTDQPIRFAVQDGHEAEGIQAIVIVLFTKEIRCIPVKDIRSIDLWKM